MHAKQVGDKTELWERHRQLERNNLGQKLRYILEQYSYW
jgi:hypothetical protein